MADPLSIASGVAGIIALAGSVVSSCYQYGCAVNDGPSEIQRLLDELMSLSGVLNAVRALIESTSGEHSEDLGSAESKDLPPPYSESVSAHHYESLLGPINDSRSVLEEVEKAMKKAEIKSDHKLGRTVKRLIWPLKRDNTMALISKLERSKGLFMLALSTAHLSFEVDVRDTLLDIQAGQKIDRLERQLEKQDARMRRITQWLCPVNWIDAHRAARRLWLQGTGSWMLKDPTWAAWLKAERSFLWLYGIPGSGKTVLISTLLDHCQRDLEQSSTYLTYFYCDFREKESQAPETLLGALICQLCSQMPEKPTVLDEFEQAHRTDGAQLARPSCEDLEKLFIEMVELSPSVIIVIDALDECNNHQALLGLLKRIPKMKGCNAKLLVSSRQETDIEEAFSEYMSQSTRVHAIDADIKSYITRSIVRSPRLQRLPPELQNTVRETLQSGARGMFRWVQCQIETLGRLRTDRDIRQALKKLPRDLRETYARILGRIHDTDTEVARRALMWLAYTPRPLRLSELVEAVTIDPDTKAKDPEAAWYPQDLLQVIGSLATYSANSGSVVLAHHSVKEYLSTISPSSDVSHFTITPSNSTLEMAGICLTYLLLEDFDSGPCCSRNLYCRRLEAYPLLPYAARFWPLLIKSHLNPCNSSTKPLPGSAPVLARRLLHPSRIPSFHSWLEALIAQGPYTFRDSTDTSTSLLQSKRDYVYFRMSPPTLTPLYYAASFGLLPIVQWLLEQGVDVDAPGGLYGGTALHAAVFRNYDEIAELLVGRGASLKARDTNGMTPLDLTKWLARQRTVNAMQERKEGVVDLRDGPGKVEKGPSTMIGLRRVKEEASARLKDIEREDKVPDA